ncbi:MAG: molybdenum cofactor biosynthesis protein B [Haloarculaceae archaeon]
MVDFQSRDTRPSLGGDDGDDADDATDDAGGDADAGSDREEAGGHDDHGRHADHADHDHRAHDREEVGVGVVTVSSTRTREDDPAGDAVASLVREAGHEVVTRQVVADDYDDIQSVVDDLVDRPAVDVVVTTGGTGITPDDVTIEAIRPLFEKELPGVGEYFRRRSHEQIGTRAVATRATAGVVDHSLVFAFPGSEDAARLGAAEVVLPEAPHLVGLAQRE